MTIVSLYLVGIGGPIIAYYTVVVFMSVLRDWRGRL